MSGVDRVREPEARTGPYLLDGQIRDQRTMPPPSSDTFYSSIPVFSRLCQPDGAFAVFGAADDWSIGVADIVESTRAIADARYKAVNMAGASVIAAVANALEGREFPFVFGGDGASFAVSPDDLAHNPRGDGGDRDLGRESLDLVMRVALVPVKAVRAQGLDVRVARFGPSPNLSYAMFSGGGLGWAEAAMKRGEFAVPKAAPGTQPDLTGLSCRFEEIPSARASFFRCWWCPRAPPTPPLSQGDRGHRRAGRAQPGCGASGAVGRPPLKWPPSGNKYEVSAMRGSLLRRRAFVLANTLFVYVIMRFGISVGGFVPKTYVQQVVENSDFRKYDDGLRMILDCTPELESALAQVLAAAASRESCATACTGRMPR